MILIGILVLAKAAVADEKDVPTLEWGTLIITIENDKFHGGTDRYYTNGVKATYVSRDMEDWEDGLPEILSGFAENAPLVNGKTLHRSVSASLGHSIFTPQDTQRMDLDVDDRPYAGWLYTSFGLHEKTEDRLDIFEVTLGIVGPSALGEEVQNNFHNLIDVVRAEGWSNQINDEPGLMFTGQRQWRLHYGEDPAMNGWGCDFIPHLGATLGNIYTHANAGFEVRAGWNLPRNFGSSLIGPAAGVSAPIKGDEYIDEKPLSFHVFLGTDIRAVGRNIFLDGNTWQDSHEVAKKPFVADIFVGASTSFHALGEAFTLTYSQAMRTEEFFGQEKEHIFGSLSLAMSF